MGEVYTKEMEVRARDIDPLDHVSHTVYTVYMQQARLRFSEDVLSLSDTKYNTVVVHLEIDYEGDVTYGDDVTIEAWITDTGSSSFTMKYAIFANGERAAVGESVQVVINEETGDSIEIPPEWRDTFDRYCGDDETSPNG